MPQDFLRPLPPHAPKHPASDARHGITRTDDYAWLRAENWQEVFRDPSVLTPEIRAHLDAENAYQAALMKDTENLQKVLFAEMRGRIKEDDSSVPAKDGPYAYGVSYRTGGEQPYFIRTPRDGGPETILLDGDREGEGKAYFRLASADHAPNHNLLIWGYDDKGSEFYKLKVRDLTTMADLEDIVTDTNGGGAWDAKSEGFFYTRLDENHRPSKVFYHKIGTQQADDKLIYEETDPGFFLGVGGSALDDYIFIDIHDHETSECWLLPADDPSAEPKLVMARKAGTEYDIAPGGDVFYILTNADGAKDFKICQAPASAPQPENWQEIVAEKPGRLILSHSAYKHHLVWIERDNSLPRIVIHDRKTGEEHAIAFDEEAYSLGLHGSAEYDTDVIRFSYSSMTTPEQLFDYNMRTRERTLLKTQEVPSGHNPQDYVTRRILAPPSMVNSCRFRCSITRTRSWTAPRLAFSTAMAPMASPFRQASAHRAFRLSIVASFMQSRIFAAARTRGSPGTKTESATRRPIRSRTSLLQRSISSRKASPAMTASSPMAARRAGC